MFAVGGIIRYYHNWCMVWLDYEIGKYYRSLLPKAWDVRPPRKPAHVSVIRIFENVPNRAAWGKYEGQSLIVEYEPGIQTDGLYYWLDCWSDEIGFIRRSLGLSTFRENDGYSNYENYHITIGNTKNARLLSG